MLHSTTSLQDKHTTKQQPHISSFTNQRTMSSRAASSNNWRSSRTPSPPFEVMSGGSTTRAARLTAANVQVGMVAFLDFRVISGDSEFRKWGFNAGSDCHPVYIAALSQDKTTATCLQTTSFGGRTIQDKFPSTSNSSRQRYLAMQHDNTIPHSAVPVLEMAPGQKMQKQSYIHLDHSFKIGTHNLVQFADGKKSLTRASASVVEQRLADFIQGKIEIDRNAPIRSSIFDRTYTPAELNLPSSSAAIATSPARKTRRRSFDQAFEPPKSSTQTAERPIKAARLPLAPQMGAFQSSAKQHKMEQPWRRMAAACQ